MDSRNPTLTLRPSRASVASWAEKPYIDSGLRQELLKANVLLVPTEGYGDERELIFFPSGTEDFLNFLRNAQSENENLVVDICIKEEDYKELALHDDLLVLAGSVVSLFVAPVVTALIANYIQNRLGSRKKDTVVKASMTLYDENGRSIEVSYEGPAELYKETIGSAIKRLQEPQSHLLTGASETNKKPLSRNKKRRKSRL
jgi:hypothetical protein